MSTLAMDPRALAIQPQRAAGLRRYDAVLVEAEALLLERGINGFSIPVLAERLGFTRRSIYKFFPTPYALFNEITLRYLAKLERELETQATDFSGLPWQKMIEEMVTVAANFHNRHAVSRMLILGGAVSDESFRSTEFSVRKLGELTRGIFQLHGISLPKHPDVASLSVDIGMAVFRVSNLFHGEISTDYKAEASHAMIAYLSRSVEQAQRV
ncbi:MAG: TetR/AcrR family transcriptional regulator [Spongiibacteraceae bacterium]